VRVCSICGLKLSGRGDYSFSYLGDTVALCGHHANRVMVFIRELQRQEVVNHDCKTFK
jgi:hypothetical protein